MSGRVSRTDSVEMPQEKPETAFVKADQRTYDYDGMTMIVGVTQGGLEHHTMIMNEHFEGIMIEI